MNRSEKLLRLYSRVTRFFGFLPSLARLKWFSSKSRDRLLWTPIFRQIRVSHFITVSESTVFRRRVLRQQFFDFFGWKPVSNFRLATCNILMNRSGLFFARFKAVSVKRKARRQLLSFHRKLLCLPVLTELFWRTASTSCWGFSATTSGFWIDEDRLGKLCLESLDVDLLQ